MTAMHLDYSMAVLTIGEADKKNYYCIASRDSLWSTFISSDQRGKFALMIFNAIVTAQPQTSLFRLGLCLLTLSVPVCISWSWCSTSTTSSSTGSLWSGCSLFQYTWKCSLCHITVSDLDNCASELCILRQWLEKILTLYEVAISS